MDDAELDELVAQARDEADNGQRASVALLLRELADAVEDLRLQLHAAADV